MIDEVYDIFNEQWEKIGTATWTEVHTKFLLHKSSAALVFRDASCREVLLQRRGYNMAQGPGLLTSSAGGHALSGQTSEECMRDELGDELFFGQPLPAVELCLVDVFLNIDCFSAEGVPQNREIISIFEAIYPGPFFYNPEEVAEPPQWIAWDELKKDMEDNPKKYTRLLHEMVQRRDLRTKSELN